MNSVLTKEDQEEMLNRKIEEMKKKNAELIRRHKLIEEDKRLAEEQGRSVTLKNLHAPYSPMKGEILRAAEDEKERKTWQQDNRNKTSSKKHNEPKTKSLTENVESGPPPDPACKFLADRRREGPLPDNSRSREFSRRHPRNFGGTDFRDVPKKIHDEKEKQMNQPQTQRKIDSTVYTTGKERRELEEWRREREKIDRERLERQKNKEGNWRREWDRDKDDLSFDDVPPEPECLQNHRRVQTVSRPVGRIGSGRFALGLHKFSGLHKPFGRKDDHFKAVGRGRWYQPKKSYQGDADHDETHELEQNKREKTIAEKPLPRANSKPVHGTDAQSLRVVHEQNDSLVIKVKNQPMELVKSPTSKTVSFMEPLPCGDLQKSHSRKGQKNYREGPHIKSGTCLENSQESLQKTSKDSRGEKFDTEPCHSKKSSFNTSAMDKIDTNKENGQSETSQFVKTSRSSAKNWGYKEEESLEKLKTTNDGNLQRSPKKVQGGEKLIGSGRISVHGTAKKRKHKNQRKKANHQQKNASVSPGLEVIATENEVQKGPLIENSEGGRRQVYQKTTKPKFNHMTKSSGEMKSVSYVGVSEALASKENDEEKKDGRKDEKQSEILKFSGDNSAKPNLLDVSFDLDQGPPEDQIDDEEWEDIDEEICIDLITKDDKSGEEENSLDISDETFDQLINSVREMPHEVVDWAAEMESVEHQSVADSDVHQKSC